MEMTPILTSFSSYWKYDLLKYPSGRYSSRDLLVKQYINKKAFNTKHIRRARETTGGFLDPCPNRPQTHFILLVLAFKKTRRDTYPATGKCADYLEARLDCLTAARQMSPPHTRGTFWVQTNRFVDKQNARLHVRVYVEQR